MKRIRIVTGDSWGNIEEHYPESDTDWAYPEIRKSNKNLIKITKGIIQEGYKYDIIVITLNLFLLRELCMLTEGVELPFEVEWINCTSEGVKVGPTVSDIGKIACLDSELEQSGRYLDWSNKLSNAR